MTCRLLCWIWTRKSWRSFRIALRALLLDGTFSNSLTRVDSSLVLLLDSKNWVQARLMVLNQESLSVTHFTISPFQYTCYQVVWVRAMLIVLNDFGLSTYVLTDKRWIGGSHNLRTNNTLITSIYLCGIDTWKTTVYVYPRLLSMCLSAPVSVDLWIRRIKTQRWYYAPHVECVIMRKRLIFLLCILSSAS